MNSLKKIIIFLVISFKMLLYIINTTITNNSLIFIIYVLFIVALSLPFIFRITFTKESFLKIMLILLVSFIMFFLYKEDNVFLYSILGLILINEDRKEIIKNVFFSLLIIFSITLLLGLVGILPNTDAIRNIDGVIQIRYSLGFSNANAAFSYFIPMLLAGTYLYRKNYLFNFIMFIVILFIYFNTRCRTGFYSALLILLFNMFDMKRIFKKGNIMFIVFFCISLLLAFLFGSTKYNFINEALSYRPWYSYQFLKEGISIWGMGVSSKIILDNLYLRLLANYSIFGVILYYFIYSKGSKLCFDDSLINNLTFFFLLYNILEAITAGNFIIIIFLKEIFKSFGVVYEED